MMLTLLPLTVLLAYRKLLRWPRWCSSDQLLLTTWARPATVIRRRWRSLGLEELMHTVL